MTKFGHDNKQTNHFLWFVISLRVQPTCLEDVEVLWIERIFVVCKRTLMNWRVPLAAHLKPIVVVYVFSSNIFFLQNKKTVYNYLNNKWMKWLDSVYRDSIQVKVISTFIWRSITDGISVSKKSKLVNLSEIRLVNL